MTNNSAMYRSNFHSFEKRGEFSKHKCSSFAATMRDLTFVRRRRANLSVTDASRNSRRILRGKIDVGNVGANR